MVSYLYETGRYIIKPHETVLFRDSAPMYLHKNPCISMTNWCGIGAHQKIGSAQHDTIILISRLLP